LAALECIDHVILFDEDTPLRLIKEVAPDKLFKGGDWAPEEVVGRDFVSENGGEVCIIGYVEGYSTTKTVDKIENRE
jgi:bifunctional ADP-heptose synthase (sugar kinase/adenylyltransferase)